jgi:hypothetical protein
MEKVVYLFEIFKIIFYYKFLKLRKVKFGSIKVWKNLKVFKPYENFEMVQTAPPVTVAPSPRVSDPSPLLGIAHMHPPLQAPPPSFSLLHTDARPGTPLLLTRH